MQNTLSYSSIKNLNNSLALLSAASSTVQDSIVSLARDFLLKNIYDVVVVENNIPKNMKFSDAIELPSKDKDGYNIYNFICIDDTISYKYQEECIKSWKKAFSRMRIIFIYTKKLNLPIEPSKVNVFLLTYFNNALLINTNIFLSKDANDVLPLGSSFKNIDENIMYNKDKTNDPNFEVVDTNIVVNDLSFFDGIHKSNIKFYFTDKLEESNTFLKRFTVDCKDLVKLYLKEKSFRDDGYIKMYEPNSDYYIVFD